MNQVNHWDLSSATASDLCGIAPFNKNLELTDINSDAGA